MEKIILIIDPNNFKPQILDFVSRVSINKTSKIVGVFVFDDAMKATPYLRSIGGQVFVEEIVLTEDDIKRRQEVAKACRQLFDAECAERGLSASIHIDEGMPLQQILKETRYADLMIADPSLSFSHDKTTLTKLMREVLACTECPVIIAPENFKEIEEIVFAYDGSKSSVAAIKQFYYTMPKYADSKIVVLHFTDPEKEEEEDELSKKIFQEWLQLKFTNFSFVTIPGDPRDGLFIYFLEHTEANSSLLVMGTFGRGVLSTFFKPSTSDLILKTIDVPVFISHF
jgi:nucleotide-binding universal stress UspA family protein